MSDLLGSTSDHCRPTVPYKKS